MKALLIYILLFAINYNVLAQTKNIENQVSQIIQNFHLFQKREMTVILLT